MIGGISYFHEFAFDLLAENERILASTFEAAIAAHRAGRLRRIIVLSSSMVFESTTVFPTPRAPSWTSPAADLHVRLPEARVGVLRPRRLGAVPAAVHDPAAVQLRGDRGAAGGSRHRRHERQRQARPVARRAGPRAQGAQGPGPAPHPGRRQPGPALHVRRRSRARHPPRDGVGRGGQRRLQPLDGDVDHRPRARRGDLERRPRRRPAVPATSRTRRSSTTSSSASPTCARRPGCSASRRRRASRRCWARSSRGSATSSRRAGCDRDRRLDAALPPVVSARRTRPRKLAVWRGDRAFPRALDRPNGSACARHRAATRATSFAMLRRADRWATDLRDVRAGLGPTDVAVRPRRWARRSRCAVAARPLRRRVFMSNYLEHLPISRRGHRASCGRSRHGLLRPGGRVIVLQPNIRFVGGAYWDFIDHKVAAHRAQPRRGGRDRGRSPSRSA